MKSKKGRAKPLSPEKRSRIMSAIRSRNNATTELSFASLLRSNGLHGWRRHSALPGKPDFAFPKIKIAVFVDGCFWHCCSYCYDGHIPRGNQQYWRSKLSGNKARDKKNNRALRRLGWRVFRIRECAITKREACVSALLTVLRRSLRATELEAKSR